MAFLWFGKKKKGTTLTDESRQQALETRRLNSELRQAQKELEMEQLQVKHQIAMDKLKLQRLELQDKIAEYEEDYDDIEEPDSAMNPEMMLMSILMNKMNINNPIPPQEAQQQTNSTQNVTTNTSPSVAPLSLSDDEIKQVIDSQFSKKQIKQLMSLPFKQLEVLAKQNPLFSTWSSETLQRAKELYS